MSKFYGAWAASLREPLSAGSSCLVNAAGLTVPLAWWPSGCSIADGEPTCASALWNQPFTIGLPSEFAQAVADALAAGPALPPGTLTIDRAGFDLVNSAEMIFGQATTVLTTAMAARLSGQDAGEATRSLVGTW
jgi:hypothetical protein